MAKYQNSAEGPGRETMLWLDEQQQQQQQCTSQAKQFTISSSKKVPTPEHEDYDSLLSNFRIDPSPQDTRAKEDMAMSTTSSSDFFGLFNYSRSSAPSTPSTSLEKKNESTTDSPPPPPPPAVVTPPSRSSPFNCGAADMDVMVDDDSAQTSSLPRIFVRSRSGTNIMRSLLDDDKENTTPVSTPLFKRSHSLGKYSQLYLPEDYGPIRRELSPLRDSIVATTDHASNVTYARLASTIITSQGTKRKVPVMDRIATKLESKGVGRGTSGLREVREASRLKLFLDDYSEANFWPLLDSLHFNKNLKELVLFRRRQEDRVRTRTQQEMDCFFRVLLHLAPAVTDLHLWNFDVEDQAALSHSLSPFTSLEYIQLHLESCPLIQSLATSLARLPRLISLEIQISESFPVAELLESPTLSILSVICSDVVPRFPLEAKEIHRLAERLRSNRTLSVLSLEPYISVRDEDEDEDLGILLSSKLFRALQANRTLDTFQFSAMFHDENEADRAILPVLDLIKQKRSSLRVLWNNCYESWIISPEMRDRVRCLLSNNLTLQEFSVFPEEAECLEENVICEDVSTQNFEEAASSSSSNNGGGESKDDSVSDRLEP